MCFRASLACMDEGVTRMSERRAQAGRKRTARRWPHAWRVCVVLAVAALAACSCSRAHLAAAPGEPSTPPALPDSLGRKPVATDLSPPILLKPPSKPGKAKAKERDGHGDIKTPSDASRTKLKDKQWYAILVDKDGKHTPLLDPTTKLVDKQWLALGYNAHAGIKPRISVVLSHEETPQALQYNNEWARLLGSIYAKPGQESDPFNHIEDLVRVALGATNHFTILERTAATQDVIPASTVRPVNRVDYLVKVTIADLTPEKDAKDISAIDRGLGPNATGIGSIGVSGKVAFCRLKVRIIDATTGVIAQDMTVDGTASGSGLNIGGGALGGLRGGVLGGALGSVSNKKMPAISDAMQACANKIAYFTASKVEDLPWQGSVTAVTGAELMINAGEDIGLSAGMTLALLSRGKLIVDPDDSTRVLGYDAKQLGTVKIVDVQPKFSTCEIVDGGQGVKKGDIVRLEPRKK